MGRLGLDLPGIWQAVTGLPQTQKDVATIAKATEKVQSPQFQEQVTKGISVAEDIGKTYLILTALGTAAMVGMFLLQLSHTMRRQK